MIQTSWSYCETLNRKNIFLVANFHWQQNYWLRIYVASITLTANTCEKNRSETMKTRPIKMSRKLYEVQPTKLRKLESPSALQ